MVCMSSLVHNLKMTRAKENSKYIEPSREEISIYTRSLIVRHCISASALVCPLPFVSKTCLQPLFWIAPNFLHLSVLWLIFLLVLLSHAVSFNVLTSTQIVLSNGINTSYSQGMDFYLTEQHYLQIVCHLLYSFTGVDSILRSDKIIVFYLLCVSFLHSLGRVHRIDNQKMDISLL